MRGGRTRRAAAFLVVLPAVLLAGCWDAVDPRDLDVVTGLAFDVSSEGVQAIAELPAASVSAGAGHVGGTPPILAPSFLITGSGPDAATALDRMSQTAAKEPFWGQLYSLYFTSGLARKGIAGLTDTIMRMPTLSDGTDVFLIDGPAAQFLGTIAGDVEVTSIFTRQHLELAARNVVFAVPIYAVFIALATPGQDPCLPAFRSRPSLASPSARFEAAGMAVFRGDRLATILSPTDSQALAMLLNQVDQGTLDFPVDGRRASIRGVKAITRMSLAGWRGGMPVIRFRVHVAGQLNQAVPPGGVVDPETLRRLEEAALAEVTARLRHLFRTLQENGSDPIGVGAWLNYHDPRAFAELAPWNRAFARLTFEFRVTVHVAATGLLS